MNAKRLIQEKKRRRMLRVRAKISGTAECPRLAVRRSLVHISVQVIDDAAGRTLASVSDRDISAADRTGKTKTDIAHLVGKLVAERVQEKKISQVVFDRRDKKYHGRVKAVALGAREGGLQF